MKTLADAKRAFQPGVRVHVEHFEIPACTRDTAVIRAQGNGITTQATNPRTGAVVESWCYWPKAGLMRIEGDTVTFLHDETGEPHYSYTILSGAS